MADERQMLPHRMSFKDGLIMVTAMIGVMTFVGNWFVYGDRQKRDETGIQSITAWQTDTEKTINDINLRLSAVELWKASADASIQSMRSNLADRSQHLSTDDAKSIIDVQMTPLTISTENIKTNMENQQKQLDHIETCVEKIFDKQELKDSTASR